MTDPFAAASSSHVGFMDGNWCPQAQVALSHLLSHILFFNGADLFYVFEHLNVIIIITIITRTLHHSLFHMEWTYIQTCCLKVLALEIWHFVLSSWGIKRAILLLYFLSFYATLFNFFVPSLPLSLSTHAVTLRSDSKLNLAWGSASWCASSWCMTSWEDIIHLIRPVTSLLVPSHQDDSTFMDLPFTTMGTLQHDHLPLWELFNAWRTISSYFLPFGSHCSSH